MQAMHGVAQTGNQAGVRSLGRELEQYVVMRTSVLQGTLGWSEEDYYICSLWLQTKRDPETVCTREAEASPHSLGYARYGSVRYCIENSIPPF